MESIEFFEKALELYGQPGEGDGEFAVAAIIVMIDGKPHILFEVRAMNMRRQPGEVCFPGGRIERGESPKITAIRETFEEVGIEMSRIRIIGRIGGIFSLLNEEVQVFVGTVDDFKEEDICLNPKEVHKVFFAPVDFFVEQGRKEAFNYNGNYIWGLTARAVNKLMKLCKYYQE